MHVAAVASRPVLIVLVVGCEVVFTASGAARRTIEPRRMIVSSRDAVGERSVLTESSATANVNRRRDPRPRRRLVSDAVILGT